jgi:hypothetical protein
MFHLGEFARKMCDLPPILLGQPTAPPRNSRLAGCVIVIIGDGRVERAKWPNASSREMAGRALVRTSVS